MFTIDQLKRAVTVSEEIQKLEAELASILGNTSKVSAASLTHAAATPKRRGKRVVSAEARARMAAAQKARWARKAGAAPAAAPQEKKRKGMSPEGRARLAAAMKARWAARKKGGAALNAPAKPAAAAKPAKKAKRNISPEARAKMAAAAKRRWANVKKAA